MKSQKVSVIVTFGLPACYGGFETLTSYLVKYLHAEHELTVYCSGKRYPKAQRQTHYQGARLRYLPLEANGFQSILYDCLSILHALFFADVLLILGVPGGILLPFVKLFTRKRIIISIDGIEWRRAKWSKPAKWYLRFAEYLAVRFSHADISDNDAIQNYTARAYSTRSRVIEYGGDHAQPQPVTPAHCQQYPFLQKPYAFKVCRIEPENNVELILSVFAELPAHPFVLVGNWNNSEFGRQLRARYQGCDHLHLLDPIYDQTTLDVLRSNCHVYVHGHSAGGTNPSLVEAMHLGLPVLAFHVSFNKATTEHKARYFGSAEELRAHLTDTPAEAWQALARDMREIAHRRYRWEVVARKYSYLIQKVCSAQPSTNLAPRISQLGTKELLQHQLAHYQVLTPFYEED